VARYSQFPDEEFVGRYERFQGLLNESDLDAVVVTAKENVLYFSGLQTVGWDTKTRPVALIMARGEEPIFVLPESLESVGHETTWVSKLALWGGWRVKEAAKNPIDGVVNTLKSLGLDKGRIGMEFGEEMYLAMHMTEFFDLQRQLPAAKLMDAAPLIWELRMIKTPREIDYLRKACTATCKAFERAYAVIAEGMSEQDLAGEMFQEMTKQTSFSPGFVVVRSGPLKYKMVNVPPFPGKNLEKGDMILLDAGAKYNDYCCDMMRMANIGGPTDEQLAFFEAESQAQWAGVQTLRDGVPAKDVVSAAVEAFDRLGFMEHVGTMERIGHGVGLDVHEPPNIAASNDQRLRSGMVVTVEPIFRDKEGQVGNFGIENNLLITDDGYEDLTPLSRDLFVARR